MNTMLEFEIYKHSSALFVRNFVIMYHNLGWLINHRLVGGHQKVNHIPEHWVGYPIYYCKTQSLGGSFTMHYPNLWAQLNYASTQTQ